MTFHSPRTCCKITFCSGTASEPVTQTNILWSRGSSPLVLLLLLTSIEWMHQSVRAIKGNTSAVHYELACVYKVATHSVGVDNPSELLVGLRLPARCRSTASPLTLPCSFHFLRGTFSFLPPPSSSPSSPSSSLTAPLLCNRALLC